MKLSDSVKVIKGIYLQAIYCIEHRGYYIDPRNLNIYETFDELDSDFRFYFERIFDDLIKSEKMCLVDIKYDKAVEYIFDK